MKYNQPYGVSDPNAPYINGNPSTGTMGSIPPAASIEYPQREIVSFINDSLIIPDNGDLRQLSKSVQNGRVNYCDDQGTPNFIAITPIPPITEYKLGQYFRIKVKNPNTGPTQVNVSNVGWAPLVHGDKTAMGGAEVLADQMIEIAWDGVGHWQMMTGGTGGLILLTAPRTLYVNSVTGNDTAYDGSQPTVDVTNAHGPFLTLQHALNVMTKYNLSGFTFTIQLADGDYIISAVTTMPQPNGSGNVFIRGNPANSAAVKILNQGTGSVLTCSAGNYIIDGVYLASATAGVGDAGNGIWISTNAAVSLYGVSFGFAPGNHLLAAPGGMFGLYGNIDVYGGAQGHITGSANASVQCSPTSVPNLSFHAPPVFGQFALATTGAQLGLVYGTIVSGGSVTGQKYAAVGNGVINTGGRGVNYLPGSTAGGVSSGGQYL